MVAQQLPEGSDVEWAPRTFGFCTGIPLRLNPKGEGFLKGEKVELTILESQAS